MHDEQTKPAKLTTGPVLIFYYKPDREVMWEDWDEPRHDILRISGRLRDFIVEGHTFEVLEYHPDGLTHRAAGDRAVWWDKQLHNLGYDTPHTPYNEEQYDD